MWEGRGVGRRCQLLPVRSDAANTGSTLERWEAAKTGTMSAVSSLVTAALLRAEQVVVHLPLSLSLSLSFSHVSFLLPAAAF